MNTYYFTFGSDGQIYYGGWVEVAAASDTDARKKFIEHFGNEARNKDGFLRCCSVYTEEQMQKTGMLDEGNRGFYCHESF